jgi:hypothetical protein
MGIPEQLVKEAKKKGIPKKKILDMWGKLLDIQKDRVTNLCVGSAVGCSAVAGVLFDPALAPVLIPAMLTEGTLLYGTVRGMKEEKELLKQKEIEKAHKKLKKLGIV